MSELIGYDSAHPQYIPDTAKIVFPYADGHFRWARGLQRERFPEASYRGITITGMPNIAIADFEEGCIWPGSALRRWAERRHELSPHMPKIVYTDRANFDEAKNAMIGFTWNLFLSTLDFSKPTIWDGKRVDICQFTDRIDLYDMSIVFNETLLLHP